MEAFSVKHEVEGTWDFKKPALKTCNPSKMVAVSHNQPPQLVAKDESIIFTYDVKFTVSSAAAAGLQP